MAEPSDNEMLLDPWLSQFLQHLTSRNSAYTLRNYRRALFEFKRWYQKDRKEGPAFAWDKLNRFDFRTYLHSLGLCKIGRSSTQIRFAALRSFYKYLVQQRLLEYSPIKGLKIPKLPKRLAQFLTVEQMQSLLGAPSGLLPQRRESNKIGKGLVLPGCCRFGDNLLLRLADQRVVRIEGRRHQPERRSRSSDGEGQKGEGGAHRATCAEGHRFLLADTA